MPKNTVDRKRLEKKAAQETKSTFANPHGGESPKILISQASRQGNRQGVALVR